MLSALRPHTPTESKLQEIKTTLESPINPRASIELLLGIIELSTFFHKKSGQQPDDKIVTQLNTLQTCATSMPHRFLSIARGELLPRTLGFSDTQNFTELKFNKDESKSGNLISTFFQIPLCQYISEHVKDEHGSVSRFHQLFTDACDIACLGFASHELLQEKLAHDRSAQQDTIYNADEIFEKQQAITATVNQLIQHKTKKSHELLPLKDKLNNAIKNIHDPYKNTALLVQQRTNIQLQTENARLKISVRKSPTSIAAPTFFPAPSNPPVPDSQLTQQIEDLKKENLRLQLQAAELEEKVKQQATPAENPQPEDSPPIVNAASAASLSVEDNQPSTPRALPLPSVFISKSSPHDSPESLSRTLSVHPNLEKKEEPPTLILLAAGLGVVVGFLISIATLVGYWLIGKEIMKKSFDYYDKHRFHKTQGTTPSDSPREQARLLTIASPT